MQTKSPGVRVRFPLDSTRVIFIVRTCSSVLRRRLSLDQFSENLPRKARTYIGAEIVLKQLLLEVPFVSTISKHSLTRIRYKFLYVLLATFNHFLRP